MSGRPDPRGQTLVEFALIAPLLVLFIGGIITFGMGVFFQQQVANAAREAARYAAIHSATSQCPTTSHLEPQWSKVAPDVDRTTYYDCDPPYLRWPEMTAHARTHVFGMNASGLHIAACWSGYWDDGVQGWDAPPANPLTGSPHVWHDCTIGGVDPHTEAETLSCPPPLTTASDDKASNLAASSENSSANQVTVYACYVWVPPFIGETFGGPVTMRAVVTEAMQHQK
jgi:hypothetical protein